MSSRCRILNCELLIQGLEVPIISWSPQYLLSFASLQLVPVNRLSSDSLSEPRWCGEEGEAAQLRSHVT